MRQSEMLSSPHLPVERRRDLGRRIRPGTDTIGPVGCAEAVGILSVLHPIVDRLHLPSGHVIVGRHTVLPLESIVVKNRSSDVAG